MSNRERCENELEGWHFRQREFLVPASHTVLTSALRTYYHEYFPMLLKGEFSKAENILFYDVLLDFIDDQKLKLRAHQISHLPPSCTEATNKS